MPLTGIKPDHQKFTVQERRSQTAEFQTWSVKCDLKNTRHFKKRTAPFFMQLLNLLSFQDQSADMLSNRETLHFLMRKNFCGVNLGLNGEGIAMSGGIGQAMRYSVTSSQCLAFEIYKRLLVFSDRITVREVDACRHPVPVVSLNTKKKRDSH